MKNTERFNLLMSYVLRHENGASTCGYVNDPDDKGGETVSGITRKNHPDLMIWKSLDNSQDRKHYKPTEEEWEEIYSIYRRNYYDRVRADEYEDINLALTVFDFAVNAGVSRAIKALQTILGVKVDGVVGPITLRSANALKTAFEDYTRYRLSYYKKLNQPRFLRGWTNRTYDCKVK